jgi:hypothetical protein
MPHVVLLGDSIFDNAAYVPGRPPVIAQVQGALPPGWKASLLAVDGHVVGDVVEQLHRSPAAATHLFVSAGGNDALGESWLLHELAHSVADALALVAEAQDRFQAEYQAMLREVLALGKPTALCTVYDAVPRLGRQEQVALGAFNEVILRTAFSAGLPVIDLRLFCTEATDYSPLSPIEPSVSGGAKIAERIVQVATGHDFSQRRCVVYG